MMTHTPETTVRHSQHLAHAILALGNGFVAHPRNQALRDLLATGQMRADDLYAQLRHLAYRLLFLLTAEARGVLPSPQASAAARQRYLRAYALSRLPPLAAPRRGAARLYRRLWTVMQRLGSDSGDPTLGVPALGRFLHPIPSLAPLADCALADQALIAAVQALREIRPDGAALVALHLALQQWQPVLHADASGFELISAKGPTRPTAVSPAVSEPLVARLLTTTLDPILDQAVAQADPETALLQLKICDPACGPGTFLHAAARRLAARLAVVRAGYTTPTPAIARQALCDVIQHCLYGVDVRESNVELCRLSLALDALVPDTPLGCLDRHIQCGDSLLGATPALLARGIPDTAFTPVAGDDRAVATALRRRNQHERLGQMTLALPPTRSAPTPAPARLLADAWCAAFLWPKTREAPAPVTHDAFCWLRTAPEHLPPATREAIEHLARQYRLLHWHVAFPEVFRVPQAEERPEHAIAGWHGGFDAILSKPPWRPRPASAQTARLEHLLRHLDSNRSPAAETLPLAALFIALYRLLLRPAGRAGCLIPAHMVTAQPAFFQSLLAEQCVASLYMIRNETCLMPRRPRRTAVCLLTLTGPQSPQAAADVVWEARQLDALDDAARHVPLSTHDLTLLNPNTRAWPVCRTARAAELTRAIYRHMPVLRRLGPPAVDAWGVRTATMLHLSRDAALLRTHQQLEAEGWQREGVVFRQGQARYVPVYEGAMLRPWGEVRPAEPPVAPRYWVPSSRVVQALSRVPPTLLHAYGARKADEILHALAAWLAGYHVNRGHAICTRETLARVYSPMFQALSVTPGAWAAAPELERAWPLTPGDLVLLKRQHDVFTLARQLIERRCPEWCIAWRAPIDPAQMVIATVLPRVGTAQTCPLLHLSTGDAALASCLLANLNSLVVDFCARQKCSSPRLTPEILYQLPVVPPPTYATPCAWDQAVLLRDWVVPRVLELIYTTPALAPFARACGYDGAPFREEPARRRWLRSELEAAYGLLYGLKRDEVVFILDTHAASQPTDAASAAASVLSSPLLEVYDALHRAVVTGTPYRSPLDPPPAQARQRSASDGTRRRAPPQIEPRPAERYKTCVPLLDLSAVADAFAQGEEVEPDTWVVVPPGRALRPGMFVAQMIGRAMEPQIPEGAYCLFERQRDGGAWQGRIVLVHHRDLYDPETGGHYTVRRYAQEQRPGASKSPQTRIVRLLPLHPDYAPLVLERVSPGERHVIAEFLAVLDVVATQD